MAKLSENYYPAELYFREKCYVVKFFIGIFCDAVCLAGLILCLVTCFKPVRPKARTLTAYAALLISVVTLLLAAQCLWLASMFKLQISFESELYTFQIVNEFAKMFFLVLLIVLAAISIKYFNSAAFGKTNEEKLNEIKEEQENLIQKQIEKKQKKIAQLQARLEELNNSNDTINEADNNN